MNEPKEAVFNTITGDDWRRSLKAARARGNPVIDQIRAAARPVVRAKLLRVLQLRATV